MRSVVGPPGAHRELFHAAGFQRLCRDGDAVVSQSCGSRHGPFLASVPPDTQEAQMFLHTSRLQFEAKPSQPDAHYARKLQELIGGAFGEMTVTMQYLFQGWNCRMEGKYKDLIMDVATEEIGHVEMLATMVARLLEGAPSDVTAKAVADDPVVAAVIGGMDPQQAIVSGGGPTLS